MTVLYVCSAEHFIYMNLVMILWIPITKSPLGPHITLNPLYQISYLEVAELLFRYKSV